MILQCFIISPNAASRFLDVPEGSYYEDAVNWAVQNGITSGTSANHFSPDAGCSRAQIVTFIWRMAGSPTVNTSNPFKDVKSNSYYYNAVLWAISKGITSGTSTTTFSPNTPCTRAQILMFLWRYYDSQDLNVSFSTFNDIKDQYYNKAVYWAIYKGIASGSTNTTFDPDKTCTRAEAVTFLYRSTRNNQVPANIHLYKKISTTEATCKEAKKETYQCILCNKTRRVFYGSALSHDNVLIAQKDSTATTSGYKKYRCTRCGETYTITIDPKNTCRHLNYTYTVITYPTPATEGEWIKTCSDCGVSITEEIPISNPHSSLSSTEQELLNKINEFRIENDLEPLQFIAYYYDFSQLRAYEIFQRITNNHLRPNGQAFHTALYDVSKGYSSPYGNIKSIGENIHRSGQIADTAETAHQSLVGSESHRNNILKSKWNYVTVYFIRIGKYDYVIENFYQIK